MKVYPFTFSVNDKYIPKSKWKNTADTTIAKTMYKNPNRNGKRQLKYLRSLVSSKISESEIYWRTATAFVARSSSENVLTL